MLDVIVKILSALFGIAIFRLILRERIRRGRELRERLERLERLESAVEELKRKKAEN